MFSAYSVTARNSSFNTRNSILDSTEHSVGSDAVVNAMSTEQRFYTITRYINQRFTYLLNSYSEVDITWLVQ